MTNMMKNHLEKVVYDYLLNDKYMATNICVDGIGNKKITIEMAKKPEFDFLKEWERMKQIVSSFALEKRFVEYSHCERYDIKFCMDTDLLLIREKSTYPYRDVAKVLIEVFELKSYADDCIQYNGSGEYIFNVAKYKLEVNNDRK